MDDDMVERLIRGEYVSRHEFKSGRVVDELVEIGFLEYGEDGLLRLGELSKLHLEVGDDDSGS